MTSNTWNAIVFDMDDTLYPEHAYVLSGFRAVAAFGETEFGIPAAAGYAVLCALFEAGVRRTTFDDWLAQHNLPASNVSQLVTVYRQHTPTITPYPDARAALAQLHGQYRLGLVSDGYLEVQQRKFAALDVAYYFDAVVFSDQWGREAWKPSHTPFIAVLQQLDSPPERAVYVGDNPAKDFIGARALGMAAIWCRRPTGVYADQTPPTADHAPNRVITSLHELESALREMG